jgi:hypothetical protein
MKPTKIVVHYLDGEVIKGFTQDFFPNKPLFHLYPIAEPTGEAIEVSMKDLKALFFVRDFNGNSQYAERKNYDEGENTHGRKLGVIFTDDELLVGSTLGYDPSRQGFFLFPADPESNNIKVFSINSSVKNIRFL